MEQQELKDLLTLFSESNLTEFNLKEGSFELYLNKNNVSRGQAISNAPQATNEIVKPSVAEVNQVSIPVTKEARPKEAIQSTEVVAGTEIVSPLVGVVYLKPAPDQPNFKSIGDHVTKGEVVCIVEAMKVMNEITSDVTGEIVAVVVENEDVVEYNQPLFRVKEG